LSLINTFQNAAMGVNLNGAFDVAILGNDFTNLTNTGVFVRNAQKNSTLEISSGNNFTNCNVGVKIMDFNTSSLTINYNIFTSTAALGNGNFDNSAIHLTNKNKSPVDYQLIGNQISGYRLGIYGLNFKNKTNGFSSIRYNQILFNRVVPASNAALNFMGIWLDNIERVLVLNNTITYNQTTVPAANILRLRGLNIKDTRRSSIGDNLIVNMGAAMRFVADNQTTPLQCNIMDNCGKGVFLDNAGLSTQGGIGSPWDNQWRNFGNRERVYGTLFGVSNVKWYYKTINPDYNPRSGGLTPFWLLAIQDNGEGPCDVVTDPPGDDGVDNGRLVEYLEQIIIDTIYVPQDSTEYMFRLRMFAFAALEENDSIRNLVPEFMNFYADHINNAIGRLVHAENAILEMDYDAATLNLNAAVCVEMSAQIIQYTLSVIREYDLVGRGEVDDLPQTVLDDLEAFAYLPSSVYGTGVFYARAILGLEVDDVDLGLRIRNVVENSATPMVEARCYDTVGRIINCPDATIPGYYKRKAANGAFMLINLK